MTQDVNISYLRELEKLNKTPVYIVEFDSVPIRYANQDVVSPLGTTEKFLQNVAGAGAQITIDEGRSSIGSLTFNLIDKDKDITNLTYQYNLLNRNVTVYSGFLDLPESDYVKMFVGRVLNYQLQPDNVTYRFRLITLWKQAKENVFTAITRLSGSITDSQTNITVVNTSAFASATASKFYIKIDDEVMSYTGKTATTFTGLTRGEQGTTAAAHDNKAVISNFIILEDNPIDIALQIMTSTGAGTNGTYDVLPASAGLAIPQADIDISKIEADRDRWLSGYTFKFYFEDKTEGKKLIESEIFKFINSYPIINAAGQISIKIYTPPLPTVTIRELNDNNIIGAPTWQGQVMDRLFFNEVDFQYDWDFKTGRFLSRSLYEDTDSQTKYQQVKTLKYESKGISSSIMVQSKIDQIAFRIFKRFANPAPVIKAKAFFTERIMEPGDVVLLTSSVVPDNTRGEMGVQDKLVELIRADPDYVRGVNTFSLIDTEFSYGRKYGAISPSSQAPISFPTWDAATPTQRKYCFINEKVNPTKGKMSDGSDGYYITWS